MPNHTPQADGNPYSLEDGLRLRQAQHSVIESHQLKLLKHHLQNARSVPFYRQMFNTIRFDIESLHKLSDLASLPLTSRADLDQHPELFSTGNSLTYSDISLTSGTTGNPVVVPYTDRDLKRLAFNETINFYSAGIRKKDTVLLSVTLDRCFIAGLAYYLGLVRLGAATIRSGSGQPERQWKLIRSLQPTAIVGVPSFLLQLAKWGINNGFKVNESTIEKLITIGEPIRKPDGSITPLGRQLEDAWRAQIYSSYGATELETAFSECDQSSGGHVHPELMITEIINDEGRPVKPGQSGEIVVTPLGVEGFPLVRFRTGDIARLHTDSCKCGWNTPRLGPIEGRLAQRLKVKGTTLYPEAIFQALQEIPETSESYIEVQSAFDLSDELTVHVGYGAEKPDARTIAQKLQAHLRVRPKVIVKPRTDILAVITQEGSRKPKKFFDFR